MAAITMFPRMKPGLEGSANSGRRPDGVSCSGSRPPWPGINPRKGRWL